MHQSLALAERGSTPDTGERAAQGLRITVSEFATLVGLPPHTVYRLLARGAVPGAFKLDETRSKSRYYIPADAPQRFVARGDREVF